MVHYQSGKPGCKCHSVKPSGVARCQVVEKVITPRHTPRTQAELDKFACGVEEEVRGPLHPLTHTHLSIAARLRS